MTKTETFGLWLEGDKLVHYRLMDIVYLIELGVIQPDSYLFCYNLKKWFKAIENKDISKGLSNEAKTRPLSVLCEEPKFMPPPSPVNTYYSLDALLVRREKTHSKAQDLLLTENNNLNKKNQELKGKICLYQKESESFKEKCAQLELEKRKIQNDFEEKQFHDISILTEKCERLSEELKKQESDFLEINQKITKDWESEKGALESQNTKLREEQEADRKLIESLNAKVREDQDFKSQMIESFNQRIEEAIKENKKLSNAVLLLSKEKKKEKENAQSLKTKLRSISNGTSHLKRDLLKKEKDLLMMQRREAKAKKIIRKLQGTVNRNNSQKEFDLTRLVGESFLVPDIPQWVVKMEGEVRGPYRFSEVLDWYQKRLIKPDTIIRRGCDDVFTKIENVYEFNTEVFTQFEKDNEKVVKNYYVKRTDFRAPFYERIKIECKGQNLSGECTSLSIGGCYIDFGKRLPELIELNTVFYCVINSQYLNGSIEVQVIVRNISQGSSCGVGCEFLDLEDEERETIESFVDSYLRTKNNKLA